MVVLALVFADCIGLVCWLVWVFSLDCFCAWFGLFNRAVMN